MFVANFTEEELNWTHEGISGVVKINQVLDMPENRARFILNKLGRRGLVQMEYSEDSKYKGTKIAESRELNKRFWVYQVESHNRHNESLKAMNKSYVRPTDEIMKAAERLGLELVGPWTVKQPQVKAENVDNAEVGTLRSEVNRLTQLVSQLLSGMQLPQTDIETDPHPEDAESDKDADNIGVDQAAYKSLPRKQLEPWIKKNINSILEWPAEELAALDERYQKLCGKPLKLEDFEG